MSRVLFLCTGNAARSVMAGAALATRRPDLIVETAGTLAVDGLPISWRTRAAFADVGLAVPPHRSRQATAEMLAAADVAIGLAPEHVAWVRREHREHAARTASLIGLVETLSDGPAGLAERLDALELGSVELSDAEAVIDPGGGEVEAFVAAARRIDALIGRLAPRL